MIKTASLTSWLPFSNKQKHFLCQLPFLPLKQTTRLLGIWEWYRRKDRKAKLLEEGRRGWKRKEPLN